MDEGKPAVERARKRIPQAEEKANKKPQSSGSSPNPLLSIEVY